MSDAYEIELPELCLVALVGASGSGKSSFAREHFLPTEAISSDFCRALISDDENDQSVTAEAFSLLHEIAERRLELGRLTVVDATNTHQRARKPLVALARQQNVLPVAIVLDLPAKLCHERNEARTDRDFGPHVTKRQSREVGQAVKRLKKEGFRQVHVLRSPEQIASVKIERRPLWNNRKELHGPFDIIGDVHGCATELRELLGQLGYRITGEGDRSAASHPDGRTAVFVGDFVDRGPDTIGVLKLAMSMVESGAAIAVPGNHDSKLVRALNGRNVQRTHGLAETMEQLDGESSEFRDAVREFLFGLVSHLVLDDDRLVVAHAGMPERLQGRASGKVRDFALYGETTGETDEYGLPVRVDWADDYRGSAAVVYGHTPVVEPSWVNNTINVDTGCVFGGSLTALRWPERELVSVPAGEVYYEPAKPIGAESASRDERPAALLDIADVRAGGVETRLRGRVTIKEENASAALEVMSRFAVDPRWLIYLPPTMSPCGTSQKDGCLEHPEQAFAYYRDAGVERVVCEEKHMGSRMLAVVCRDPTVAERRFGIEPADGCCFTRTGRPFFTEHQTEHALLARLKGALDAAGTWSKLDSDWVLLDCELMPWSAKAEQLLRDQYAAVGAAAGAGLEAAADALRRAEVRGAAVGDLGGEIDQKRELVADYRAAYRHYQWSVDSVDELRVAPFHVLASEGAAHVAKPHSWHLDLIEELCAADPVVARTDRRSVDLASSEDEANATAWWEERTNEGTEGMVVKLADFTVQRGRELIQPAVKCRGRQYLRIIYGPEYTLEPNLKRLRSRGLGRKRSLAVREYALGVEALERFARGEPLYRVHECVFGVLALESEPVDPRL